MEPNLDRENVSMTAASMQVDDSVKNRIMERIKDQMARKCGPCWMANSSNLFKGAG